MIICPACGFENTPGADDCEKCGSSLDFLSEPVPSSHVEERLLTDEIRVLEPREPVFVTPDARVGDVLQKLVAERIGCVLVVDPDRAETEQLVGVFSERDALMRLGVRYADLLDRPISEFMTASPETLGLSDKIAFALHKMDLGGYRHVPVHDEDRVVVGIISVRDILRYLADGILKVQTA